VLPTSFTYAILKAQSLSVPLVRPNRYCLTLPLELKLRILRKNALRQIAQDPKNGGQIKVFEIHNMSVRDMCVELRNRTFGGRLHSLRPDHKFFWNFTKINKNKCRSGNGVTLIIMGSH
jgi:hypothetical protein